MSTKISILTEGSYLKIYLFIYLSSQKTHQKTLRGVVLFCIINFVSKKSPHNINILKQKLPTIIHLVDKTHSH